jgi:hypothetical protein
MPSLTGQTQMPFMPIAPLSGLVNPMDESEQSPASTRSKTSGLADPVSLSNLFKTSVLVSLPVSALADSPFRILEPD